MKTSNINKHYTCPSSVIGITATRSKYKKKNLALVSLAADASLEQLIPQADEWSFKKMMRTALATTAAVRDLHRQGKVHPNLQPRNLLVYQNRLELVDDQDCFAHKQDAFYGRWPYIAPEHQVTPSANIYSLGIMLWQLSSGIVFPHWVTTSPDLFRIRPLKHMDEGYQQLWKKCLSREPASRPTADDVCEALVQTMMSHMALGHECTNDMLKSEALAHAAEVRQHQMNIARYLAHVNPCVAKQALADMTERASLSKRMMFQMAVSIERRWQKSPKKERKRRVLEDDDCAMTSCNSVYGTDLPDFVQIGYV